MKKTFKLITKKNEFETRVKYKWLATILNSIHWLKMFFKRLKYIYKVLFVWKSTSSWGYKKIFSYLFLFSVKKNRKEAGLI